MYPSLWSGFQKNLRPIRFYKSIWTMPAPGLAAESSPQQIPFRENILSVFNVVILAFDQVLLVAHGQPRRACTPICIPPPGRHFKTAPMTHHLDMVTPAAL